MSYTHVYRMAVKDGKLGLEAPIEPALVDELREDSAFETQAQRKEVLRAFVDVESTGALGPWMHAAICSSIPYWLTGRFDATEEPTSWTEALRKGWFHGEGGSIFDAWLTSSCAQMSLGTHTYCLNTPARYLLCRCTAHHLPTAFADACMPLSGHDLYAY